MKKLLTFLFAILFAAPCFATGVSGDSATCDSGTLSTDTGPTNLRANYESNTLNLKWHDENGTPITSNTCTYGGTITMPTAPTKRGYTFKGWKVITHTTVEYIESTGTQYIDTLFSLSDESSFDYEMKVFLGTNNTSNAEQRFFSNERNVNYITDIYYKQSTKNLVSRYTGHVARISDVELFDKELFLEHKNNITKIVNETDNVQIMNVYQTFQTYPVNQNFFIGTKANTPATTYGFVGKIYYLKFWASGTLVRNFIPAKNILGAVGMYDTVSQTFFTNAGTGEFIAGPVKQ